MSHVPTVLKSDRSVFDKMLPADENESRSNGCLFETVHVFIGGVTKLFMLLEIIRIEAHSI